MNIRGNLFPTQHTQQIYTHMNLTLLHKEVNTGAYLDTWNDTTCDGYGLSSNWVTNNSDRILQIDVTNCLIDWAKTRTTSWSVLLDFKAPYDYDSHNTWELKAGNPSQLHILYNMVEWQLTLSVFLRSRVWTSHTCKMKSIGNRMRHDTNLKTRKTSKSQWFDSFPEVLVLNWKKGYVTFWSYC